MAADNEREHFIGGNQFSTLRAHQDLAKTVTNLIEFGNSQQKYLTGLTDSLLSVCQDVTKLGQIVQAQQTIIEEFSKALDAMKDRLDQLDDRTDPHMGNY